MELYNIKNDLSENKYVGVVWSIQVLLAYPCESYYLIQTIDVANI